MANHTDLKFLVKLCLQRMVRKVLYSTLKMHKDSRS